MKEFQPLSFWFAKIDECEKGLRSSSRALTVLFEKAVSLFPRSYKLWYRYLTWRVNFFIDKSRPVSTVGSITIFGTREGLSLAEWESLCLLFERALLLLDRMPGIWKLYLESLLYQNPISIASQGRAAYNRALQSLPITQHNHIWPLYCAFSKLAGGETCIYVWKRFCQYDPSALEDFCATLQELEPPRFGEAACLLLSLLEIPEFKSKYSKTRFELWSELCDLACAYAEQVKSRGNKNTILLSPQMRQLGGLLPQSLQLHGLGRVVSIDVERLIKRAIQNFRHLSSKLWTDLARFFIATGDWQMARKTYSEALTLVDTAHDFTIVYNSFLEFEESVLSAQMEGNADDRELDFGMARLEWLIGQRPLLLNDVYLRQNPNRVLEWDQRVNLHLHSSPDKPQLAIDELERAIATISPRKAEGRLSDLHLKLIELTKSETAKEKLFQRAVTVPYAHIDELVSVWLRWIEHRLESGKIDDAISLLKTATNVPTDFKKVQQTRYDDEQLPPQSRLFKSLKLWGLYADLEENVGTFDTTAAIYEQIIKLKIANPLLFLNYAAVAESRNQFELMFQIYERAIDLFGFPVAYDIWILYLSKFVDRYGGTKLERARDLFEQSLFKCSLQTRKRFLYLMYAQFEEKHGLTRRALKLYDRCADDVPASQRGAIYKVYIGKAKEYFGASATREIYQKAIESLPEVESRDFCVAFCKLEVQLNEPERARAILAYGAQYSDPRVFSDYWEFWQSFELEHGDESTFKDMLRVKKSVRVKYATQPVLPAKTPEVAAPPAISFVKASADGSVHPMDQVGDNLPKKTISFVKASNPTNDEEVDINL